MCLINYLDKVNKLKEKDVYQNIKLEEVNKKNNDNSALLVLILGVDLKLKLSMIVFRIISHFM